MKHFLLAALAASLGAQNITSPPGHLTTEAGGYYPDLAGAMANYNTHVVHVDDALRAFGAHTIQGVYLRRDGDRPTDPAYAARALPVQVRMAQADFSRIVNAATIDDATLRLTPWQTVFTDKVVAMPSFVTRPATSPAPWSIALLLDTPFAYHPGSALAIHLRIAASALVPAANYPFDATNESTSSHGFGTFFGAGCQVSGRAQPFRIQTRFMNFGELGSASFLGCYAYDGVGSAPWVVALGSSNPSLPFGGCTPLYTSAEVVLPAGTTNASGQGSFGVSFKHHPSMVGASFWLQAVQPDAGQGQMPYALSNGSQLTYPTNPTLPSHAVSVSWSQNLNLSPGHWFYKGGTLLFGLAW